MSRWPKVALGEVADWGSGGTPSRKNPEHFGEGTPWLSIADLNDGLVSSANESLTSSGLAASAAKIVPPGTVLIAMYGSIGKLGIAARELCTSQAIAFARPKSHVITTEYLFHVLLKSRHQLVQLGRGGTQSNIGQRDLKRLAVPLPPIDEQRRIAAILDHQLKLKDAVSQSIRLLDDLADSLFADSFLTHYCDTVPLGDLISDHQLGLDRKSSEQGPERSFPYLKMDSITSTGDLDLTRTTKVDCSTEEMLKYSLRDGDLIFNTRNTQELVGKSTVYRGPTSLFNNNILRLRFCGSVEPDYIHRFLWSQRGSQQLHSRKSGTTSVWAIYLKSIKTIQVPLPDIAAQREFAHRLEVIRTQRMRYQAMEELHAILHGTLASRAFRGEL